MSHFYGIVSGAGKTNATRRGHKSTGITTYAASYDGAIKVTIDRVTREDGTAYDRYRVFLTAWPNKEAYRTLLCEGDLAKGWPSRVASPFGINAHGALVPADAA
jgi:hypothetical protein